MTTAAGGKLTSRNLQTERVIDGKCFWILGENLGGYMKLDMSGLKLQWKSEVVRVRAGMLLYWEL